MQKQIPRTYEYLFAGGQENSFLFKTDNEIVYEVKFKDTSYLFSENLTEQKPPLDSRIPVTITAIFYDFIDRNNEQVVIYICDSSDDKQAIRHRKFTQWFESFKGNDFVKINAPITDNRTVVYYTSLIIHRHNPKRQEITEAFINLTDDQQK